MACDTLAGLSNLRGIAINSKVTKGSLPSGFFNGLKNLTMIGLKQAELNFIPPFWLNGLDNLQQINFSNNTIQTLPSKLFDETGSLTHVWLQHNPWNCSCELRWLLEWSDITGLIISLLNYVHPNFCIMTYITMPIKKTRTGIEIRYLFPDAFACLHLRFIRVELAQMGGMLALGSDLPVISCLMFPVALPRRLHWYV